MVGRGRYPKLEMVMANINFSKLVLVFGPAMAKVVKVNNRHHIILDTIACLSMIGSDAETLVVDMGEHWYSGWEKDYILSEIEYASVPVTVKVLKQIIAEKEWREPASIKRK